MVHDAWFQTKTIPFPEKIVISLPFDKAETLTEKRAVSEKATNFTNPSEAAICTLSFAASELAKYLKRLTGVKVTFAQTGFEKDGFAIAISCGDSDTTDSGYTISPAENGVALHGFGRVGALYAVYAFLYAQGIRWYYPGDEGEEIPSDAASLYVPACKTTSTPDIPFRSFDIYQPLKDSEQYLLWMARNRMNTTTAHPYTAALGHKLGMVYKGVGGHIFDVILQPDNPLPDGRTIWDAHPEWYGLPANGVREKETALRRQFCVTQSSLIDYLADAVIEKLRTDWKEVYRVELAGFDAGPDSACHCEACQKLGNDTDKYLYFLSELRRRIDAAEGIHPYVFVFCSYEGTRTHEMPLNPIPDNLKNDHIVFYNMTRCYCHDIDDPDCKPNKMHFDYLKKWANDRDGMVLGTCEYYNLSRYEDHPLLYTRRIKHDIPLYHSMGSKYFSYMHPPLYNWGVRALNHMLVAQITWNTKVDAQALEQEYFQRLYGDHAPAIKKIYEIMENATEHISAYRSHWQSALGTLEQWAGGVPTIPLLDHSGHFPDNESLVARMEQDLKLRKEALTRIEAEIELIKRELVMEITHDIPSHYTKVRSFVLKNRLLPRMQELRRSFIYCSDELELMMLFSKEYILALKEEHDPQLWAQLEKVYDRLSSYFYPHKYITQSSEAYCEDGLTRTFFRGNVDMRRIYKIKMGQI